MSPLLLGAFSSIVNSVAAEEKSLARAESFWLTRLVGLSADGRGYFTYRWSYHRTPGTERSFSIETLYARDGTMTLLRPVSSKIYTGLFTVLCEARKSRSDFRFRRDNGVVKSSGSRGPNAYPTQMLRNGWQRYLFDESFTNKYLFIFQ